MVEIPTNVEDFDTFIVGVLVDNMEASDSSKERWVLSRLLEFIPDFKGGPGDAGIFLKAAEDYLTTFGSRSDRRVVIRKLLGIVRETNYGEF